MKKSVFTCMFLLQLFCGTKLYGMDKWLEERENKDVPRDSKVLLVQPALPEIEAPYDRIYHYEDQPSGVKHYYGMAYEPCTFVSCSEGNKGYVGILKTKGASTYSLLGSKEAEARFNHMQELCALANERISANIRAQLCELAAQ